MYDHVPDQMLESNPQKNMYIVRNAVIVVPSFIMKKIEIRLETTKSKD